MVDVNREEKAKDCKACGGKPPSSELVNHSLEWHDGDVICTAPLAEGICGRFIRYWDAG